MKHLGKMKTYRSSEIKDSMVSIGFECLDREMFRPEKCYGPLGESGVKYARCQTGWIRCEKEKGVYDFAWLDDIVDSLLANGVIPWFNVGFGNPIYMENISNPYAVGCVPLLYGEEVLNAWKNYVRALAEHFCGRVTHWEIWNEPQGPSFWYPGTPNATQYAELIRITGGVIHEKIPGAKIGGNIDNPGMFAYIRELAGALTPGELDFFAYHIYGKVPEMGTLENQKECMRIFREHGHSELEFWQGEGGFPSWAHAGHWLNLLGDPSEHQQAVWQLRRYLLDASCGVKRISFFQMADMMERPYYTAREIRPNPARHGILNGITYTPKKSYETISRLATLLSGDLAPSDDYFVARHFEHSTACEMLSVVCLPFLRNGQPFYAYWLPTDLHLEEPVREDCFTARIRFHTPGTCLHDPVLIDLFTGDVWEVSGEYPDGEDELVVAHLPIAEYPMILCERSLLEIEA